MHIVYKIKVSAADVRSYRGEGKPPFCEMLLTPQQRNLGKLQVGYVQPTEGVTFLASVTGIKPPHEVKTIRAAEPFQSRNSRINVIPGQLVIRILLLK